MFAVSPLPPFPAGQGGAIAMPGELQARGFSLRSACDADIPWLRALYASTRAGEMEQAPWPAAAKQAFLDSQFGLQHQHYLRHYADADFLVIERDGAPLGRYYLHRGSVDYLIVDISLEPAMRGQGIATSLIGQTQRDAGRQGRGVRLHVHAANSAAQRLYARLGFAIWQETEDGYRGMRWPA